MRLRKCKTCGEMKEEKMPRTILTPYQTMRLQRQGYNVYQKQIVTCLDNHPIRMSLNDITQWKSGMTVFCPKCRRNVQPRVVVPDLAIEINLTKRTRHAKT